MRFIRVCRIYCDEIDPRLFDLLSTPPAWGLASAESGKLEAHSKTSSLRFSK